MIFYTSEYEKLKLIPESYAIAYISDVNDLINRMNVLHIRDLYPKFTLTDDSKINKRKYINQLKTNELQIAILILLQRQYNGHIVLYCNDDELEEFNFLKILVKFIKKKYEMKVFKFTFDVTFNMIEEAKMGESGVLRYMEILSKNEEEIKALSSTLIEKRKQF